MEKVRKFLFENSGIRQTIIKNTFWVAVGTTLTKIIRVVIIIYVARILGTEDYGIFTYAMSLVGIFSLFSDIGLTSILTRELSKRTDDRLNYLSTSFIVKICFLVLTVVLIVIFAPLISKFDSVKPLMLLLALTVTFESLRNFFYAITRAQNKMETEAGLAITTEILITVIIVLAFFRFPSINTLVWSYTIGNGVGLIITAVSLRKYISGIFKHFQAKLINPIVRASWPFAIMGISSVFMTNIDSIIIGIYSSPHLVGLYAAAQKPLGLLHILPNFLGVSLFPLINKLHHERSDKKLSTLTEKSMLISLAMALPIVIGGIIVAEPLIMVTFGREFIGAVATFQILLISLFFVFPGSMLADLILAKDRQLVFIKSSILGAITNVVLDLILIPAYGITGSAIATLVAVFVVNSIFYFEIRKDIKFSLFSKLGKIIISTIVMSIVTYSLIAISLPLIPILIISGVVYFSLLFLMKEEIIKDVMLAFKSKNEIIS